MLSNLDRTLSFLRAFARRRAQRVVELPEGFAVLDDRYAQSYDNNKLIIIGRPSPKDVVTTADAVFSAHGLHHRMVLIEDDRHGHACAPALVRAGYLHEVNLIMVNSGLTHGGSPPVHGVAAAELRDAVRSELRARLPSADPETIRQLIDRREVLAHAADQVVFLAVRDRRGRVVSHADLYLEPAKGIAQIEDLCTDPAHAGRGHAREIMKEASHRAHTAGCDLLFLVADADDWPQTWYRRLGFTPTGATHLFTKRP